jgi:hypothetical protein
VKSTFSSRKLFQHAIAMKRAALSVVQSFTSGTQHAFTGLSLSNPEAVKRFKLTHYRMPAQEICKVVEECEQGRAKLLLSRVL